MKCSDCGVEANRHAVKVRDARSQEEFDRIDPDLGGIPVDCHTCPECGKTLSS